MIGTELHDGLGNQIFEYVAARTIAERLGSRLMVRGRRLGLSEIPRCLLSGKIAAEIGDVFPGVVQSRSGAALEAMRSCLPSAAFVPVHRRIFPKAFRPRSAEHNYEFIDPTVDGIADGTWIWGYFQSERYFPRPKEKVLEWLRPSRDHKARIDAIAATMPAPPEKMVSIHVRRGDYLRQRDPVSHPTLGWGLPMGYYDRALADLPKDVHYAVFSDDVEFARSHFAALNPWTPPPGDGATDMLLMARCRYMVIANSSLSWWAAWLNTQEDKVVVAPMYHAGWHGRRWVPEGIDVEGWRYIAPDPSD